MALQRRTLLGLTGAGLAGGLTWNVTRASVTSNVSGPESRPDATDEDIAAYTRGNAAFGLDLLGEVADRGEPSNLLLSPLSVSGALAMTWAGARGDTEAEMRETLRFPHDQATLHPTVGALQYDLNERAESVPRFEVPQVWRSHTFELAVANALWGQAGYPFREPFLETLEENYGGGLREVDFRSNPDGGRTRINGWAASATNGRVDDLIPENALDDLTRLVLTNAVYLLADWKHPFDPDDTEPGPFTAIDGTTSQVPMMHQEEGEFRYVGGRDPRYQVVELPYVGGDVSMVLVLPPEGAFESFLASLDGAWLADRFAELDETDPDEVRLVMPRFEFASNFELSEPLEAMGMETAFGSAANFDGIAPTAETGERLFIADVFHDTYVRVDEEGTEAAAASGVHIQAKSAPPAVTLDRPFLFLIRDRESDAVLFLGQVVDAAAAAL